MTPQEAKELLGSLKADGLYRITTRPIRGRSSYSGRGTISRFGRVRRYQPVQDSNGIVVFDQFTVIDGQPLFNGRRFVVTPHALTDEPITLETWNASELHMRGGAARLAGR